ncbi:hypothetical protein DNTS_032582 [Danionella cerebrum]|uniref:RBD domain-containing protein n=2 Tax=Danionella cerebrum TaxID=2873325 RepID=A0A553PY89_9TELE|nr:hypothetical protein DNTS_032582 [Danionella translucida]
MAASTSAVSVLTPNGRRQTVKVSPSTPLLQVLEDVCKKHGFDPDQHGLKFQRNVLDLSLPWRFAALPNNAKLEMVQSSRQPTAIENTIRIALQTEDGSRLQGSFSSALSLWDLLTHFPQCRTSDLDSSELTPVCVYMRDEVCGVDALKRTTLKSLGLTGGSAIIRYVLKASSSSCLGPITMPTDTVAKETASPLPLPEQAKQSFSMETSTPPTKVATPTIQHNANQAAVSQTGDEEVAGPSQQCHDAIATTSHQFNQPAPDALELATPSTSASHVAPPSDFVPFSGSGQRLGGATMAGLKSSTSWSASSVPESPPKAKKPKPSQESQSAVKTKQVMGAVEEPEEHLQQVDREALVFHLDSAAHRSDAAYDTDLSDDFFEVTIDDIRKRFAHLKSERRAMEEAPLMTKSLREAQIKEKLERYPKVALRVQFPDRHVLQGLFRPLETVVAPPKSILDDPGASLFQVGLFPAAVVYVGTDAASGTLLRSDLLDLSISSFQADQIVAGCMPRSTAPPLSPSSDSHVSESPERTENHTSSLEDNGSHPHTRTEGERKVPKWLKLPGKK